MHRPSTSSIWFKVGIVLLVANVPFGYGGIALSAAIAATTRNKAWLLLGGGTYVFSWLMLGVGVALTGRRGWQYAKHLRHRLFSGHKKPHHLPPQQPTKQEER